VAVELDLGISAEFEEEGDGLDCCAVAGAGGDHEGCGGSVAGVGVEADVEHGVGILAARDKAADRVVVALAGSAEQRWLAGLGRGTVGVGGCPLLGHL
jgi:hypothetical protein